jgi:hypothetical protein
VSSVSITLIAVAATLVAVMGAGYVLMQRTAKLNASVAQLQPQAAQGPAVFPSIVAAAVPAQPPIQAPHETPRSITWPALVDENIGELAFEERQELVSRLAIVGDDWTLPILRRAVHEEHDPAMIDTLVDALISKRRA